MRFITRLLGAASALLLIVAAVAAAHADHANVAPVTPDTLAAIGQLFPTGTSLERIEQMLGQPDATTPDSITYRGVYFEISRQQVPNIPVLVRRGDCFPGSATVVFTRNKAPQITGVAVR